MYIYMPPNALCATCERVCVCKVLCHSLSYCLHYKRNNKLNECQIIKCIKIWNWNDDFFFRSKQINIAISNVKHMDCTLSLTLSRGLSACRFICLTLSFCIRVFLFAFGSVLVWVLIEQNHRLDTPRTHTHKLLHSHSSQGQFRSYYLFRCIQSFGVCDEITFFCFSIRAVALAFYIKILVLMQNIFCVFICLFAFVVARPPPPPPSGIVVEVKRNDHLSEYFCFIRWFSHSGSLDFLLRLKWHTHRLSVFCEQQWQPQQVQAQTLTAIWVHNFFFLIKLK